MGASQGLDQQLPSRPGQAVTCPFQTVPLEVLLRITNHLTSTELGAFRLTCRAFENCLHADFSREFFAKRQFMLTEESLQTLIDISKSRIASSVKHVIIGLDTFHSTRTSRRLDPPQQTIFCDAMENQDTLLWSGHAAEMLTEAFRNLRPTTVGIRDYYSGARRWRDGPGSRWVSYGANTIQAATGENLIRHDNFDGNISKWVSQVFLVLMLALGSAGALPEHFEVLRKQGGALSGASFNLPKYLESRILPVAQHFQTLLLAVHFPFGSNAPCARYISEGNPQGSAATPRSCPDYPLRLFLGKPTTLKHLRLNFSGDIEDINAFLKWLAAPTPPASSLSQAILPLIDPVTKVARDPNPIAFPQLEELNIGTARVYADVLLSLLRKLAPSLKRLELWKVTLRMHDSDANPDAQSQRRNIWIPFLRKLRKVPNLELRHIMIGLPSQAFHESVTVVQFKSLQSPGGTSSPPIRTYTGIDWKYFVREVEADMELRRSTHDSDSDSQLNMDIDDDQDSNSDEEDMDDGT